VLSQRLITGPVLIIAMLGLLWLDEWVGAVALGSGQLPHGLVILSLCLLASVFAAAELSTIAIASGRRPAIGLVIAGSWALLLTIWSQAAGAEHGTIGWPLCVIAAAWFGSLIFHTRDQRADGVLADAAVSTATIVYIGGFLGFYLLLRQDVSAWWILAVVLTTKSCDIGAYFTGMCIGRHKLIPWLSPGKTVEGFFGGIVVAMGVALLANWLLAAEGYTALSTGMALLLGLLLAIFGQAGDLCMSLLKRDAGVKDSSTILPGMGGVMDVLDSPLLVAPIAWLMLGGLN
jgi:phosphatidate cytidylyltransferase